MLVYYGAVAEPDRTTNAPAEGSGLPARTAGPLAILAAVLVFFGPWLFGGKIFLAADTLAGFYPWRHTAPQGFRPHNTLITDPVNYGYPENYNRQLKAGELSNWNPYVMMGVPAVNSAGMGVVGRRYPVKLLLHRLFPTNAALMLFFLLHLLCMGLFMYLYLAEIGAGRRGALFGALVYMFNGCAMVWFSFDTVIPVGACFALLLYLMEGFLGPQRYRYAAGASLAFGALMLLGHIQYNLYVGMMLCFYAPLLLYRSWRRGGGRREMIAIVACLALMVGGGAIIGAAEILPMLEVIRESSRIARDFDFNGLFTTLGRVPFRYLVTLVFPDYFGSPVLGYNLIPSLPTQEYMNYNELTLYLGIPALFGLLAAGVSLTTTLPRFYFALTLATIGMMTGTYLFYPFFALFPGLDRLNPTRIIFLFSLVASVSAGLGVRALEDLTPRRRNVFLGLSGALLLATAGLALWGTRADAIAFFDAEMLQKFGRGIVSQLARLRSLSSPTIAHPLTLTALTAALFAVYALFPRRRFALVPFTLILALAGYDLISFGWGYNTWVRPEQIYPKTPAIGFLQSQPGPFRVVQDVRSGLYVNTLNPFQIQELGGYTNVYPQRVNRLASYLEFGDWALAGGRSFDRWVTFTRHDSPLYDLLNVRYLLTAPGMQVPAGSKYRLAYVNDLAVFENTRALPRAFLAHRAAVINDVDQALRHLGSPQFDPSSEVVLEGAPPADFTPRMPSPTEPDRVAIERYEPDTVVISASTSANGWLVLSDTHYPGWGARLDGRETPILRADVNLRAVAFPAGRHTVVFSYEPAAVRWGILLSTGGGLIAAITLCFLTIRERRLGVIRRP